MSNVVCIKVANLRKEGYSNLEQWINTPNNIYTGRAGKIFITENGEMRIFHYKGSKWQNHYKLSEYSVEKSLSLYIKHLFDSNLIYDIQELSGKNLGCFCEIHRNKEGVPTCHAQVLSDLSGKCKVPTDKLIENMKSISTKNSVILVPSVFYNRNEEGDFSWMITRPEYRDVLFVFNDNADMFLSHSCIKGAGNAVIRPYQCKNPPQAIGIPTGNRGTGYENLKDRDAKNMIDLAITNIKKLLDTGIYKRLFYSSEENGKLGTGIFNVGDDVKNYIVSELKRITV